MLILNWNGKRFLGPCLQSVIQDACRHVEVVVVDNGSTDDSIQYVRREFESSRIVALPENLGYGRAYNAAVPQAHGRFLIFLNNDTVVQSGWLAPLVDELILDSRVAITTSKVLFLGTRILNSAGGQLKLWQGAWDLGFGCDETFPGTPRTVNPFYGSGAAMAISREVFNRLDGFDHRLQLYGEDLDLSWRARLAGYTILFVPESTVYHYYSGTSGVFDSLKLRLVTRHHIAVMIKCLSLLNLIHSLPAYILFAFAKGTALSIVEGDLAYLTSVARALTDTARRLGDIRQQRRSTQSRRVEPDRRVFSSEGFGLLESPLRLVQLLRETRRLNMRRVESTSEEISQDAPRK